MKHYDDALVGYNQLPEQRTLLNTHRISFNWAHQRILFARVILWLKVSFMNTFRDQRRHT